MTKEPKYLSGRRPPSPVEDHENSLVDGLGDDLPDFFIAAVCGLVILLVVMLCVALWIIS